MNDKYEKLQQDFDTYFSQESFSRNSCLVKVMNPKTKEIHPDHISFTYWQDLNILSFNAYLNNDLETYKVVINKKRIIKKVKPENMIQQLSKYKFDLQYMPSTSEVIVVGFSYGGKKCKKI